jgi:MFS family permease
VPGFIVAGVGTGLVNPPLASTAIGVVAPHDAGMASGMNSTFRQIGIATAVAALGSIFTAKLSGATPQTLNAHYASALNELLVISGVTALVAAVLATILIRPRDFVASRAPEPSAAEPVEVPA